MMPAMDITVPAVVDSQSEEETHLLGERFAKLLSRGETILLFGDLGSGKTRLVQGFCSGLNVAGPVVSPTFTIINQYAGMNGDKRELTVHHIDCYRLKSVDELIDIGADEILASEGINFIEWPELAMPLIRGSYWKIEIESGDEPNRRIIRIDKNETDGDDDPRH